MNTQTIQGSILRPPAGGQAPVGQPTAGRVAQLEASGGRKGGSRSGYAKDLYPQLLEPEEAAGLACPVGTDRGGQLGKPPPHLRRRANYDAVDAQEAVRRLSARRQGAEAPIVRGIDSDPELKDDSRTELFDRPDAAPSKEAAFTGQAPLRLAVPPPQQPEPAAVLPAPRPESDPAAHLAAVFATLLQTLGRGGQLPQQAPEPAPTAPPAPSPFGAVAKLVAFSTPAGEYSVPAIDVIWTDTSVLVVLPLDGKHATFIPSMGAKLVLTCGETAKRCFFPGACFRLPEMKALLLVMLIDERPTENSDTQSA